MKPPFFLLILLILTTMACREEVPEVQKMVILNDLNTSVGIDLEEKMILYNGPDEIFSWGSLLVEERPILFADTLTQLDLTQRYEVEWKENNYIFFRTELPILKVQTRSGASITEEYESAQFSLIEAGEITTRGELGVRLRGNTSLQFPKKSYRLEVWEDSLGSENRDVSFLEMREDDDWLLDGMWNEPLMIRDKSAMELWLGFGRVHYQSQEPKLQLGADRAYCEFFLDGQYQGLYYLGERLDRKQLRLEKFSGPSSGGELYKAKGWGEAVGGFSLPVVDNSLLFWGNYEVKYPDQPGTYDWNKLRDFTSFYLEEDQAVFEATYAEQLDVDNIIDYFLFINVICAFDNAGNNIFIARRDQESPYYFVSWDFDATLGIGIYGDENRTLIGGLNQHKLTQRLLWDQAFITRLKDRWDFLRSDYLHYENIIQFYTQNHSWLEKNYIYERESLIPRLERPTPSSSSLSYLEEALEAQLRFMDDFINAL